MVATLASIHRREESARIQRIWARYRGYFPWGGKNNRSVARLVAYVHAFGAATHRNRFRENREQFLTARRLSGQPVAVPDWKWHEGEEEDESTFSRMHSNLPPINIGCEADMEVCAQRKNCAQNRREFFRSWLGIC